MDEEKMNTSSEEEAGTGASANNGLMEKLQNLDNNRFKLKRKKGIGNKIVKNTFSQENTLQKNTLKDTFSKHQIYL